MPVRLLISFAVSFALLFLRSSWLWGRLDALPSIWAKEQRAMAYSLENCTHAFEGKLLEIRVGYPGKFCTRKGAKQTARSLDCCGGTRTTDRDYIGGTAREMRLFLQRWASLEVDGENFVRTLSCSRRHATNMPNT